MASPYNWPAIRAGIFAGESGGDYDALFGFSNRPGQPFANTRLRDMTVDQAIAFSDPSGPYARWVKGKIGRVATPMGAYQIVGTTLRAAKKGAGLTGNERMDEATQDRLGQWILAKQGTGAWEGYRGPRDPASVKPPNPYANMPDGPKGQEAYPTPNPYASMPDGPKGQEMYPREGGILSGGVSGLPAPTAEEAASFWAKDGKEKGGILTAIAAGVANMKKAPQPLGSKFGGDARQGADQLLKALTSPTVAGILSARRLGRKPS